MKYIVENSELYDDMLYVYSEQYARIMMFPSKFINNDDIDSMLDEKFKEYGSKILEDNYCKKNISLISIIVSNLCNMKCSYCYENFGTFGKKENTISHATANKIVDFITSNYESIETICFFGGEPFLAINAIEYICDLIEAKYKKNIIKTRPLYKVITNGTILNESILKVLKKYEIKTCVSLDGFKEIHDKYRVYKNGEGTYDDICKNMEILNKNNLLTSIQTTYYKSYIENNISMLDIKKYYYNKFGIKMFIFNDIYTNYEYIDDNLKKEEVSYNDKKSIVGNDMASNIKFFIESGAIDFELYNFLVRTMKNKESRYMCNAGYNELAINLDGNIYPCRVFLTENFREEYLMGNVSDYDKNQYEKVLNKILKKNYRSDKCCDCKDIVSCGRCLALYLTDNKKCNEECVFLDKSYKNDFYLALKNGISLRGVVESIIGN